MSWHEGRLSLKGKQFLLLLLLYGCLVSFAVSFSLFSRSVYASFSGVERATSFVAVDGTDFYKVWNGCLDSVSNIVIRNLNNSQIIYNDGVPADHTIHVVVAHNTLLNITWTDWRGAQCEVHKVECLNGSDTLTNTIPTPPKSTATNQKS